MAKAKKAWFIGVDGTSRRLPELEGRETSLREFYPIIGNGCDIAQLVALKKGVDLWCDEEGLLKADPIINWEATRLYRAAHPNIDPRELGIVGNAILIDNTKAGNFYHE